MKKNIWRRTLSLLLALALLCSAVPRLSLPASAETYSGTCGDNLTWSLDTATGRLEITGSGNMYDWLYDNPWRAYFHLIKSVVIQNGVTRIGDFSFYLCDLTSVAIPDSVTSIGIQAFSNCRNLTDISIPSSVTEIGEEAFHGCVSLTAITVSPQNNYYSSDSCGVLFNKNKTTLIRYPAGRSGSYTIPYGVITLDYSAFMYSTNLTSVSVPASVTSIGYAALILCDKLTSITVSSQNNYYSSDDCGVLYNKNKTKLIQYPGGRSGSFIIPESVTTIGHHSFDGCAGLTSVSFPDGLLSIEPLAFYGCINLTSVSFPDSLLSIEMRAFGDCKSLTKVIIPSNVQRIEGWAFAGCDRLTSVKILNPSCDISQDEETLGLADTATIFGYIGSTAQDYANQFGYTFVPIDSMAFCSSALSTPIPVSYSESFFSASSYEYNHDLAWLSLCLELSSWTTNEDKYWGDPKDGASEDEIQAIIEARTEYIEDAYKKLGFVDENTGECTADFYNYECPLDRTKDKVAYAIATQKLPTGETLVSVVIRGGGYGGEWGSNFHVGTGEYYHDGFYQSMLEVYSKVKVKIASVSGPCTLWITGYSRGAAVANLLAARLDDDSMTNSQTSADRIFAYTFATPQGVTTAMQPSDARYNNIFNVVNPGDLVPNVALTKWGFSRYGVTKAFDYNIPKAKQSLINSKISEYGVDGFNVSHNLKLATSINAISNLLITYFPTSESSIPIQKALLDFMEYKNMKRYIGSSWEPVSLDVFVVKMSLEYGAEFVVAFAEAKAFLKSTAPLITSAIDISNWLKNDNSYTVDTVACFLALCKVNGLSITEAYRITISAIAIVVPYDILNTLDYFPDLFDIFNMRGKSGIKASHEATTYLAWMVQDEAVTFGSSEVKNHLWTVSLHCPIDIAVYDAEGTCVAQITNHQLVSSDIPVLLDGESTEFFFDESPETYRIKITPTDEGTMTYCVTELNEDQELVRRTSYLDVPVEPGQEYIGSILATEDYTDGMYDLTCVQGGSETQISADEVLTENAAVYMTVEETEGGTTTGAGSYFRGDTATLRAYPNDEYEFRGWYRDGGLVSAESTYRIELMEDAAIQAVFAPTTCEHVWGNQTVIDVPSIDDALYLGYCCEKCGQIRTEIYNTCGFTDVKSSKYYYKAVLWATLKEITSGTDATHFSPNATCTRAQVMTFLWKAYGSPEPANMKNPFTDVQPGKYYEKPVLWAYYHEPQVTGGMNATTFGVKNGCTRAQVVMFLWAAAGKPEPTTTNNPFSDVKEKDYFYKAVLWAVENGITGGTSPTTFSPRQTCTRGQIVTFLYKAVG